MAEQSGMSPAPARAAGITSEPDFWTVVAIAVVAYAISNIFHEGIGHGGACVLTGGKPLALSAVHFECEGGGSRWVAAGGTLVNLVAGFFFWLAARRVKHATRWRYFLWLSMTVQWMQGTGYFLFSGVGGIGDWTAVIRGLEPPWLWRMGLILVGAVSYLLVVWVALLEMRPFLGQEEPDRLRHAKKLALVPYFAGGILFCAAGMLNPVGMILVAISAAAASFGGTSGLAWMWQMFRRERIPTMAFQMPPLSRSRGWMIAAGVVGGLFVALLGPGVRFP